MTHQHVKVIAHFVNETTGHPIDEPGFKVRLYDQDPVVEDFLGEAPIRDGRVEIMFDLDKASSFDTPFEERPDLYFIVFWEDEEVGRTQVRPNEDFLTPDPNTGIRRGLTKDLGTFRIPVAV